MALLQISEPGESPEPHQAKLAAGIDLGTTHSLVASVRSGSAEVLEDGQGDVLLPSVVRYGDDGEVLVGTSAVSHAVNDATNTISSVKRLMGRGADELGSSVASAYDLVEEPGMVRVRTVQGDKSPVEVSAEILRNLRARAEATLGGELHGVVITVPAYFDDAQRQATKDAAALAGLNVFRLLNEPTAAAVAYGLDNGAEGIYAIYDLGGGTFDISILRLSRGVFEVIATGGDSALGGDDFDEVIATWAYPDAGKLSPGDWRALKQESRRVKEALSGAEQTQFSMTFSNGQSVSQSIDRETFALLSRPLLQRTLDACQSTIEDADLQAQDVKGVVLVGGSTRMPQIAEAVGQMFGSEPLVNIDPDEVVAVGAALQANQLAGNQSSGDEWLLLDVIPLSLGLETMGGLVEKVIHRNETIPVAKAQQFTTFKDGQTALAVHIVQGERELVADCRSLAQFELRGIPPMAAGAARIEVTFQVDADGLLSVSARELESGVEAAVTVKPSYGLSDDEITGMLESAFESAGDDMRLRALREAQVDADRLLEAIEAALSQDADLLDDGERQDLDRLVAALRTARDGQDVESVREAVDALSKGSDLFAARRMDRSVARALSGRSIEDL
ncbi:MAG: Fe-S protein assembly chaperone HscA [Burkholderiaceae bacterium]